MSLIWSLQKINAQPTKPGWGVGGVGEGFTFIKLPDFTVPRWADFLNRERTRHFLSWDNIGSKKRASSL